MARWFILLLPFLLSVSSFSQDQLKFSHLSVKDGLSNNEVLCVLQDHNGFIWFGTANGLNRYDGYSFKVYQHVGSDSSSLSDKRIRAIAEDHLGRIWIGTNNGLNCFDPIMETYQHFYFNENDTNSISNNRITRLHYSQKNILWIGTENGLNKFDPATSKNTRLTYQLKTKNKEAANEITSITEDADSSIWIGMWWGGLKKINPENLKIISFFSDPNIKNSISNDNVLSVFCDKENTLWIVNYMSEIRRMNPRSCTYMSVAGMENMLNLGVMGQDQSGNIWLKSEPGSVIIYNPLSHKKSVQTNRSIDASSISTGSVSQIFNDRSGIIWLGTDKGISCYDPQGQKFLEYYHQLNLGKRDYCKSFYQDRENNVWIAVWDLGLVKYNLLIHKTTIITHSTGDSNSLSHSRINGISADNKGYIWVATNNGISIVEPSTARVIRKLYYSNDNSPAVMNSINAHITGGQSNFFWMASGDSLTILNIPNQQEWQLPLIGKASLNYAKVNCVTEDSKKNLWIGTEFSGLFYYETATADLKRFELNTADNQSISSNTIYDIMEDRNQNIWVCTQNGLKLFDSFRKSYTTYNIQTGLSANECFSVKEDTRGRLWIMTPLGIDVLERESGKIIRFDDADGLLLNSIGLVQTEQGKFFSGHAENGFYCFNPDSILDNYVHQKVFLTDFLLYNKPAPISKPGALSPLKKNILETDEIILNHSQSFFGFEFSSLDYSKSGKNQYEYKLDGFDDKWFLTDAPTRRITYTNLNPGAYVFRVKAANAISRDKQDETKIKITILPPVWKTWWAYTLYFIAISALLLFIRKYFIDKERLQHEIAIKKIEASNTFELAQMKQRFFINVSHEFRTPLTLIAGPVEKLIANLDHMDRTKLLDSLLLIKRNTKRLSQLTNQLLDIRKIETGNMKLSLSSGDLVSFIREIANGFNTLAEKKQIDYPIVIDRLPESDHLHWFDADKIDKIVSNILSNAFKFTPNNGKITIRINEIRSAGTSKSDTSDNSVSELISSFLVFSVEDTGMGIAKDQVEKIFERFYQVDSNTTLASEGSGIGLALTKDLVSLCNGTIEVNSEVGKGSKFSVRLPVGLSGFSNYLISEESDSTLPSIASEKVLPVKATKDEKTYNQAPVILIVEDNEDMQIYIRDILLEKYQVILSDNGIQGIEIAQGILPDLIISDVMMPELDGYELTVKMKNDQRTSHIPIILLTAYSSIENHKKGLENEADDYITKPFDEEILLLTVRNLIQSRQRLKAIYSAHLESSGSNHKFIELVPKQPDIPSTEKIFLAKIMTIIEKHMDDPDFDVPGFASEIGMESSVLHRKMRAVINQSPGEFIRSMRMKRAAQLMTDKDLPIGEIANMVGFADNTRYFSTSFRKYFGKSPREYQISLNT
jgi:signal transduction histidine kinase/ligand-binding sensor domain-containing protein/DNA-binding NarL/FixJ family response regulator